MPSKLRVAVVTPYYRETPEILRQCHDSVRSQTHPADHFLVAEGNPQQAVASWVAQHIILPTAHGDCGNTPRCLGSLSAMKQGYDAIAFLDADNWFYPGHIGAMIDLLRQTDAIVATATRSIHRLDGSLMYVDLNECNGKDHVDTNCFFLTRPAFGVLGVWTMMPTELNAVGDTVFWQALTARGYKTAHHREPTVAYRTQWKAHYQINGEPAPPDAKSNEDFTGKAVHWWQRLPVHARCEWSTLLTGSSDRTINLVKKSADTLSSAAEHNNRGVQLLAQRQFVEAETAFHQAARLAPDLAEISFNIAKALQGQHRFPEAEEFALRAARQRPDWVRPHILLGALYHAEHRLVQTQAAYQRALEIDPQNTESLNGLGANVFNIEGRIDEARAVYQQALAIDPNYSNCHSNLLFNEQYAPGVTLASLAALHARWHAQHAASLRSTWKPFDRPADPDRPLRIGFVSGDLFLHAVALFFAPVLERLTRAGWFTACYANQQQNDEMTRRLSNSASLWRWVEDLSDEALAQRIRDDQIDLLIDLSGHTGRNRLLALAHRPAPVQFTWLGYVGTTGLPAIDYLIADRFQVPGESEGAYTEKILRFPDDYVCFEPPNYAPPIGPLPALAAGHVTFGCFNNTAKINAPLVKVWARILHRLPSSRLILKYHWLDDADLQKRMSALFAAEGIAADRLELLGSTPHREQLQQYNRVDIALDSHPYNGGLTTLEASWMGVPVITCPGETFAARHSLSHLSNIGLTETIAANMAQYEALAVKLASDLPHLAAVRAGLRSRMACSPVCDLDRFAQKFAAALRQAWRDWCAART